MDTNSIISNADIIIVTSKFSLNIANNLSEELKILNFNTVIVNNITDSDKLHIILFSFLLPKLPKNYILYQLEQLNKSNYITNKLYSDISSALITIDYSKENITKYKSNKKEISYQMMPIVNKIIQYYPEYSYDIIFFGSMNERRKKILDYLSKENMRVATTDSLFGDNLYYHLKKAKIILNLHYYDNALLETARLNEILQFNTLIISENSNLTFDNQKFYKDDVFFIENIDDDLNNIEVLIEQIYDCLHNFNTYMKRNNKIRKNTIQKIYDEFSMNLKKNLISIGYLNSKLYHIEFHDDKIICLCENYYNYYLDKFKKINNNYLDKIMYHHILKNKNKIREELINYKVLSENLLDSDYQYIITCNLDCVFPQNFNTIINSILEYFIISCSDIYINLPSDIKIENLSVSDIYNNLVFVKCDKYSRSSFTIFSRNFAKIFVENYNKFDDDLNIDKLIKDNNILIISNNIQLF